MNFSLSDVSFTYLGALAFDGKPPLVKFADVDVGCRFDHVIPTVPVSVNEKVRQVNLTKVIKNSSLYL